MTAVKTRSVASKMSQPHQQVTPQSVELSVIVVAYNSPALLQATLVSVIEQTRGVGYELIVVDNASTDPGVRAVTDGLPQVRLVAARRNLGYAAANNLGLQLSQGRYVCLLNPDTVLHDDALSMLVRWLDEHPAVGAAGPLLLQPNGEPQPYSYGSVPTPWYLLRRGWSHLWGTYLHAWRPAAPQSADWVAGTCMMVRRAALDEVGPLDERFFLYFEDVDWGLRFNARGWKVILVPSFAITHVGGGSVGRSTSHFYDRSLVRLYAKLYGGLAATGVWAMLQLYRAVQHVVRRIGQQWRARR